MAPFKDYSGHRWGLLVAVSPTRKANNGQRYWLCQCDCGNSKEFMQGNLARGRTTSCGCDIRRILAEYRRAGAASSQDVFRRYVKKTDSCWLWTGIVDRRGYGRVYRGRMVFAHRFSYELHVGQIPKGLIVRHSCDVPGCVNPDHLRLGTQRDNVGDMFARGRGKPRGKSLEPFLIAGYEP